MRRLKEPVWEFSFGCFEFKRLMEHKHRDVQKGLEIRVWNYGRKSKLESTILQVMPTMKIVENTKGNGIPEKVMEEDKG